MKPELLYQIGLTLIDGIGDIYAKGLLAYCGSPEQVFKQKKEQLLRIPGIGEQLARSITASSKVLKRAEKELLFIEKYKIRALFYTDDNYPNRLRSCTDSPVMLYYKGNADLNAERIVAIIGTRRPDDHGISKTQELVAGLRDHNVMILSGLAYGIDGMAHKVSLEQNIPTVGVLAHGLDRIYPQQHDKLAKKMLKNGGLLTDFMSETTPDAVNFPKRNRIVAGLCDALVVMQSTRKGGSLITATIAGSYNRDVFAYPGRAAEVLAEGTNGLIKRNKAALIESADDLLDAMQWNPSPVKKVKSAQLPLLLNLSDDERAILSLFDIRDQAHIDEICQLLQLPVSKVSALLLNLEFSNLIKSKPGKLYARS